MVRLCLINRLLIQSTHYLNYHMDKKIMIFERYILRPMMEIALFQAYVDINRRFNPGGNVAI